MPLSESPAQGVPRIASLLAGVDGRSLTLSRDESDRHNAVFNVLDYGAVGDGAADDTAAIQAAVNAAAVRGGTVWIPWSAAAYRISAAIVWASGVRLLLDGQIQQTVSGAGVITGTGLSNVELTGRLGGALLGYSSAYNGANANAVIGLTHCTDYVIRGVAITRAENYGIVLTDCSRGIVADNRISNFGYAGIMCLAAGDNSGCDDLRISGNVVRTHTGPGPSGYGIALGCSSAAFNMDHRNVIVARNRVSGVPYWNGLDVHGGRFIAFVGNIVTECRRGIEAVIAYSNSSTPHLSDVLIADNVFTAATTNVGTAPEFGVNVGGSYDGVSTNYTAQRITVARNQISGFNKWYGGGSVAGLMFTNVSGLVIADNVLYDNAINAVVGVLQTVAASITDAIIARNSVSKSGGTAGSYGVRLVTAGADNQQKNVRITDNRIRDYAYSARADSVVQNGELSRNDVTGYATAAIDGTPANFGTLRDNIGFLTANAGHIAAAATGVVVTHGLALAPSSIVVTPGSAGSPAGFYVAGVSASSFTINWAGGGNYDFYWTART